MCLFVLFGLVSTLAMPLVAQRNRNARNDDLTRALSFEPVQAGIDYDKPTASEIQKCKLESAEKIGKRGHLVFDANNQILRAYLDNNKDGKPDTWSYYKDGIEVYRDIDSNFNLVADQHRWLGTAGTRWALDTDEDGKIDSWKEISPEGDIDRGSRGIETIRRQPIRIVTCFRK